MKNLLCIACCSILFFKIQGQSVAELDGRIEQLWSQRNLIDDSIKQLSKLKTSFTLLQSTHPHLYKTKAPAQIEMKGNAIYGEEFAGTLNQDDSVYFYDFYNDNYLARSGYRIGMIPASNFKETKELKKYKKSIASYRKQEQKQITQQSTTDYTRPTSTSSYSGSSSRTIHTGPRGGQYYINKNGNKTYVKRKR